MVDGVTARLNLQSPGERRRHNRCVSARGVPATRIIVFWGLYWGPNPKPQTALFRETTIFPEGHPIKATLFAAPERFNNANWARLIQEPELFL